MFFIILLTIRTKGKILLSDVVKFAIKQLHNIVNPYFGIEGTKYVVILVCLVILQH